MPSRPRCRIAVIAGAGLAFALVIQAAGCAREPDLPKVGWITRDRLLSADKEPQNWLTLGRDFAGSYYSPLRDINDRNVAQLGFAWQYELPTRRGLQASPIVVDGVMFTSGNWGRVYALDAATGRERWTFDPRPDGQYARNACCDVVNRGVAVWEGRVYVASLDGWLYSLDAATGAVQWKVDTITDRSKAYTTPGAPQVAGGVVVIGNAGADLNVRGYVTAYDLKTGAKRWRFFTVPRDPALGQDHPDLERAAATWDPRSLWTFGGGGTAWDSMLYDPALNLLYVGTGNGAPISWRDRSPAGGDNLFLASILAINPDTGRLVWHYQTTPGENWDYTATMKMVLADLEIGGRQRQVLMQAPKNGFFYVLDRRTGELLAADKFAPANWASHVDLKTGRPVLTGDGDYQATPKLVFPSPIGARSWQAMAFNPGTGLVYIPAIESAWIYVNMVRARRPPLDPGSWSHATYVPVEAYRPDMFDTEFGIKLPPLDQLLAGKPVPAAHAALRAWDPRKQRVVWEQPGAYDADGGVMSTAGNLVVRGHVDGELVVYAADTGRELKRIQTGSSISAAPVTYRVGDTQYIAVMAGLGGASGWSFPEGSAAYRYGNRGRILAFRLDGGATPLPPPYVEVPVPEPPRPTGSTADIAAGAILFGARCGVCHTNTRGIVPDLTRMSAGAHAAFPGIVLEGLLRANGMPQFDDVLKPAEVSQIHAYLIDLQSKAYAAQRQTAQSKAAER